MTIDEMVEKASPDEVVLSEAMRTFLIKVWETNDFRLAAKEVGWPVKDAKLFFADGMKTVCRIYKLKGGENLSPERWIKFIEGA